MFVVGHPRGFMKQVLTGYSSDWLPSIDVFNIHGIFHFLIGQWKWSKQIFKRKIYEKSVYRTPGQTYTEFLTGRVYGISAIVFNLIRHGETPPLDRFHAH